MSSNLRGLSVLVVGMLSLLMLASHMLERCDDVFEKSGGGGGHMTIIPNGDAALLSAVEHGTSLSSRHKSSTKGGGESEDEGGAAGASNGGVDFKANGVMAVVLAGTSSLLDGTITGIFRERLLHATRMALLTGSPWLIIPWSGAERKNAEEFLLGLNPPAETLFPDEVLASLPPVLQELAIRMRDSMSFEASLGTWMQRGRTIDRLSFPSLSDFAQGKKAATEGVSSPRVVRYGASEWIIPAIVWDELHHPEEEDAEGRGAVMNARRAARLLQQRHLHIHTYLQEEALKAPPIVGKNIWPQKECVDILVVSSMCNERYARALFSMELRRVWRQLGVEKLTLALHQQQMKPLLVFLEGSVRVLVTSAGDPEPAWVIPSPLLVSGPSSRPSLNPNAGWLARFLGVYAYTIHLNYSRWVSYLHASLVSYRLFSFLNEMINLVGAILTETISLQNVVHTTTLVPDTKEWEDQLRRFSGKMGPREVAG